MFNFVPYVLKSLWRHRTRSLLDDQRGGRRATSVLLRWLRAARAVRADRE